MNEILTLRFRMKAYGALPRPGGLLDQDESMMALLDTVEGVFLEAEKKKQANRAGEAQREEMLRRL